MVVQLNSTPIDQGKARSAETVQSHRHGKKAQYQLCMFLCVLDRQSIDRLTGVVAHWSTNRTRLQFARLYANYILHMQYINAHVSRSSDDQANNPLPLKVKKFLSNKIIPLRKKTNKMEWFSFDPHQVVCLVGPLGRWIIQVEMESCNRQDMQETIIVSASIFFPGITVTTDKAAISPSESPHCF